MNTNLTRSK